jgi:hypothetical protein
LRWTSGKQQLMREDEEEQASRFFFETTVSRLAFDADDPACTRLPSVSLALWERVGVRAPRSRMDVT